MKRNLAVLLALLLALAFPLPDVMEQIAIGNRNATAAESVPPQPAQQMPQVLPAQPGFSQGGSPGYQQRPMTGMGGMPGMPGMRGQAAANAERLPQQPVQQMPQGIAPQPPPGQGAFQGYPQQPMTSMGGMGCMGGMGGMAGMGGGMGGMSGMAGMGGTMDQGLAMREVLYIMSLQDALQVMTDLLGVQEKLLSDPKASDKESLRKELTRIKEQARKISSDYREVLSGRLRGE